MGACSERGVKQDNEDCFGAYVPAEPQLTHKGLAAVIADGMSGSEAGKEASHCCVVSFLSDYFSTPDSWSVKTAGQKILSATNSWLYSQGHQRFESVKGMVSTLSVLVCKSTTGYIFHVGDSRIYRLRDGDLEQLTRDHRVHISSDKSYLNRAMGIEPHLEVDFQSVPLEKGDVYLMVTDGISDFLDQKTLLETLKDSADLDQCAQRLVDLAKANHSNDNLTCQLLRLDSLPQAREDEIMRHHTHLPFPPPLEPGMVIDGYRIEEELHASKRTHIYRAFDTFTGCQVIVKAPSVLHDDDTHYIEHFLHEEWAGKRLQHENIVKVLGSDRKKSCIYYVTEFIRGPTLRQWMDSHPMPPIQEVRGLIEQIVKGVRAFHRMEMLHQDLKPENIMMTQEGQIKIIDFGSVKIAGIAEIVPADADSENLLGTLNYSAPEYHLGQTGTPLSDQFSLGVIAYEMINGALPFGRNMPEKPNRMNLSRLQYVPSLKHNAMVPVWIDKALKKATSIAPQMRYEALSEFMHDLTVPNPKFLQPVEQLPLMERNPLRFWKLLCGVLLLTNMLLLFLLGRQD